MSKIFFTSDLHFLHKNIVQYTKRGVKITQEEHDAWLINLWNSQVGKSDIVWHIGDFCMSRKPEDWLKIFGKLNGQKFFIKGNHCSGDVLKKLSRDSHWQFHDYKEIKIGVQHICLMHFPIAHWHRQRYGAWMLHGHLHGNPCSVTGKILDVGLDSAYNIFGEHRFFEFGEIQELMAHKDELDHHSPSTSETLAGLITVLTTQITNDVLEKVKSDNPIRFSLNPENPNEYICNDASVTEEALAVARSARNFLSDSFMRGAVSLEEATRDARQMVADLERNGTLRRAPAKE